MLTDVSGLEKHHPAHEVVIAGKPVAPGCHWEVAVTLQEF
jgi:hypothetical protein